MLHGWGRALASLSEAVKKEEGVSLHGGMDEHSLMLHLQPQLVSAGYKNAAVVTGATQQESIAVARRPDWPGYLGSPRLATAAIGERIWTGLAGAAAEHMLTILDGADATQFPRYADLLWKNPFYQEWIKTGAARDAERGARQQEWLAKRR